ncbi:hypothetical protein [Ileibacterium valens]|uniref:Uncharacterized protein n=1 Tax=Ileibacterium valens TaxID=1862668 RepID=A0A1U7NHJ4_9FIRM|nr:hypothetical protein [Ileibacterium valens]OLU39737.1 hypothetical protein BO224_06825 [Erysipelotrichaceae bacterium NYU-BL-E8]OLU39977.1 hypothetical protein BM735_06435 [Erysipelotrichaceae bacterium NYU-BL-F16]OLU41304.1 hypothetical protein BO222_03525 [Ileibacterium valens]
MAILSSKQIRLNPYFNINDKSRIPHSITFGKRNTWDHWGIVPTSLPVISPPGIDIRSDPNSLKNGSIIGGDIIAPYTTLQNREGDIEFIVVDQRWNWAELYSEIMSHLHGFKMKAILEDDPEYFYQGRFSVSGWDSSNDDYSRITISYNLDAYKYLITDPTIKEI